MEEKEMITISKKEYDRLDKVDRWLTCLEQAGVDNWEVYNIAIDVWEEHYPGEEI